MEARRLGLAGGLLLLVGFCGGLSGCGYQPGMGEAGSGAPTRLHVGAITNETGSAGLQGVVAAAVRRRLLVSGHIQFSEEREADAILRGRVTGYQTEAVAFDRNDIGRRFRLRLTMLATLSRKGAGGAPAQREIAAEAFYTTGTGASSTRTAEEEALQRAVQELAGRVAAAVLDGW
jgi:hypothetical protein